MPLLVGAQDLATVEQRLRQLRKELSTISLLGQLPLDEEDIRILRDVIKDEIDYSSSEPSGLSEKGPLSLSCFLVWMGIEYYGQGIYWAKVQNHLGKEGGVWQHRWGEIFLNTIERYKLTVFNTEGLKYVTPILLHGGIPDRCLPDFFSNVLYPIVDGAIDVDAGNPEEFLIEWRSKSSLYQTTDIPVRRFLEEGGKPAADFLDRCIEMAQIVYYGDQIPPAEELGLPDRVVESFSEWWTSRSRPFATTERVALRRPLLELDTSYGGVLRCSLPEQTILNKSESPVLIQVKGDEKIAFACEVPSYIKPSGVVTEPIDCVLPPAGSYKITLQQPPELSRAWLFDGVGKDGWIAFDVGLSLIRGSELPRGVCWIALDCRTSLDENAHVIIEAIDGTDQWESYRFSLVDLSEAESLVLIREGGKRVPLPVAKGKDPELSGELLAGCNVKGMPVYTGRLPTIQVPLSHPEEIDGWDLIVEDLTGDVPLRRYAALRDVVGDIKADKATALLSHAILLGVSLFGEYRVKVRSRGALGRNKQFQFAFVRNLEFDFEQAFFLSDEPVRLTLLTDRPLSISSEDPATQVKPLDGLALIAAEVDGRLLHLNIEESNTRRLALTLIIPRLRWTVRGLANKLSAGWLAQTLDAQIEDFESSDEVTLIVQLPTEDGSICTLELERANQHSEVKTRNGAAHFSLDRFRDSLRALDEPVARFFLSFKDAMRGEQRVCPLAVYTTWIVEGFEALNVRRVVSFSWDKEAESQRTIVENNHTVLFRWRDKRHSRSRKLRLWSLSQVWDPPNEFGVPDGASELKISEERHLTGRFRVELVLAGEFGERAPVFLPRKNEVDVFDIGIGGECQTPESSWTRPRCFQHYLTMRLADRTTTFDLSQFTLASDDIKALLHTLVFLLRDGRTREVKQIWFTELIDHIRRPLLRSMIREQLKQLSECAQENVKNELRNLCQTIHVAADSLIPFEENSKVLFEDRVALYKGISTRFESKESTSDVINLEYVNKVPRTVSLSFLDKMRRAPEDAPLSGI